MAMIMAETEAAAAVMEMGAVTVVAMVIGTAAAREVTTVTIVMATTDDIGVKPQTPSQTHQAPNK